VLGERGPGQIAARPSPSAEWTTFRFEPRAPGGYASAWMGQWQGSRRCVGWRPAAAAAGQSDRRASSLSRSDPEPESPIRGASSEFISHFNFFVLIPVAFSLEHPLFVSGVVHNSFFFFSFLFALVVRKFSFVRGLGIELGSGASRSITCVELSEVGTGGTVQNATLFVLIVLLRHLQNGAIAQKVGVYFCLFSSSRLSFKDTTWAWSFGNGILVSI
jgi:hypothetical protein